ncbi:MAG: CBS domain-containing protein [Proteobacteria bacterium]|nr:CBS domain-containing protein [Pseudomonadota bacterium]
MTAEEILNEKGGELHSVSTDTTIHEALTTIVDHRVGSVLVTEGSRIVGIWTERDPMRNSIEPGVRSQDARHRRLYDSWSQIRSSHGLCLCADGQVSWIAPAPPADRPGWRVHRPAVRRGRHEDSLA